MQTSAGAGVCCFSVMTCIAFGLANSFTHQPHQGNGQQSLKTQKILSTSQLASAIVTATRLAAAAALLPEAYTPSLCRTSCRKCRMLMRSKSKQRKLLCSCVIYVSLCAMCHPISKVSG